jgi:hypothetical protein
MAFRRRRIDPEIERRNIEEDVERNKKNLLREYDSEMKKIINGNEHLYDIQEGEEIKECDIKLLEEINKKKKHLENYIALLIEAEVIWGSVRISYIGGHMDKLSDEEKMSIFSNQFKEFSKNFSIVSKYMVCLKMYNRKCLRKLIKLAEARLSTGDREDEWIRCQASYVKNIMLSYNDKLDGKKIFEEAYRELKREFEEFRQLHKEAELEIKEREKQHKRELIWEMVDEMKYRAVSEEDKIKIKNALMDRKYEQNFRKVIKQIPNEVMYIEPAKEAKGTNLELQQYFDDEKKRSEIKRSGTKIAL